MNQRLTNRSAARMRPAPPRRHAVPASEPRPAGSNAGFTVVELLIALVMITAGVLALAGSSAVIIQATSNARSREMAARIATARAERLAALKCSAITPGSAAYPGVLEEWSATHEPGGWASLRITVTFLRLSRTEQFETMVACG